MVSSFEIRGKVSIGELKDVQMQGLEIETSSCLCLSSRTRERMHPIYISIWSYQSALI